MRDQLTPEQIEQHRRDGFLIVHDFLAPEELEHWRRAIDEALVRRGRERLPGSNHLGSEDGSVFVQRLNLWQTSDEVRSLLLSESIGRMCCQLEGVDAVRVWHDQALFKRPWDDATTWHRDDPYFGFDSPNCVTIWVALDDVTMQNGCLYFLPGTHKLINYEPAGFGPKMRGLFDRFPEWEKIAPVPVVMKAGSCSFHNGLTAHSAGPNMTIAPRRAMTCAFMPDGSRYNGKQNILSNEYVARIKVGDLLDDERQNPMVYSRATVTAQT